MEKACGHEHHQNCPHVLVLGVARKDEAELGAGRHSEWWVACHKLPANSARSGHRAAVRFTAGATPASLAHSGQFPELHASLLAPACLAEVLSCPVFPQLFARLVPGVAQDISGRFYSPSQNPEAGQDAAVPFSLRAPEAGGVPANNEA